MINFVFVVICFCACARSLCTDVCLSSLCLFLCLCVRLCVCVCAVGLLLRLGPTFAFVVLIFLIYAKQCRSYSYVNRGEIGGSWKEDGCSVSSSNATHTECTCDHFTHFGVLMQLDPEPEVMI